MIRITTNNGLHDFVGERVISKYVRLGLRAVDLGSGPGAMAIRLKNMGCEVMATDRNVNNFSAELPHSPIDFNQTDFAFALCNHAFGLVTAIEVIEHVENPIGFLRNIARMLSPGAVAILTTPNVDSLPVGFKFFFLAGKIRTIHEYSEPTHFFDLLQRQLPLAGLRLREHLVFPPDGFPLSRKSVAWFMRLATSMFLGESIIGDNHIFVLEAAS